MAQDGGSRTQAPARFDGCVHCHEGIEAMHPEAQLSCVACHGGNADARTKLEEHPRRQNAAVGDERVAPPDEDLAWRRFIDPMDLRVAAQTCGVCHEQQVKRVHTSLHATTAGHLSDGYYENGLTKAKRSPYSIFGTPSHLAEPGDVEELVPVPPFRDSGARDALSTHYADLARKECMQCHLWSPGRAVQGRVGFDGDYRGEGCAACHVTYALDGLSESADATANHTEPGHPKVHAMTRAPSTETCTSCHYGDASIGLNFRGLSQLPPGAPGGPEIPGTSDAPLNRQFYLDDPALCPPDIHHEKGMHCIDCHTQNDVMGDGVLHGAMEHAVEIACRDCHGTFTARATLRTQRGTPLAHMRQVGADVQLVSKVDGALHVVPQVVDVLDSKHARFDADAACAMTKQHEKLECYLCHSNWNPNFMGFHFDRNESLSQLDLLSGARTKGRVTTQEKVFATWRGFYAGLNEAGRFAPYLTGFSTMGTVRDEKGAVLIDQALPVTAAGLSGMTMIHHQMHTVRRTARSCVECHRTSTTWGMGSGGFELARQLAVVADRRGLEIVALARTQLAASTPLAKLVLPDVVALELDCDPLQGRARYAYVAEGFRGVHVVDLQDPTAPRRVQFVATLQPKALALAGEYLFVADGAGGLRTLHVESDGRLTRAAVLPTFDASSVQIRWPFAYLADGPGGLVVVDIRNPREPRVVGGSALTVDPSVEDHAVQVATLFQYSHPLAQGDKPSAKRSAARLLVAALDENTGPVLFDVTEPSSPERLWPPTRGTRAQRDDQTWRGLALASHVDVAEAQGGARTREGDYLYALVENSDAAGNHRSALVVFDASDPKRMKSIANVNAGFATEMLACASFYNAPFLQTVMLTPGELGVFATDVSISAEPKQLGALAGLRSAYVVALEKFPLDKMLDEAGRLLKDVSHADSRWLTRGEIERLLLVPGELLGTLSAAAIRAEIPGETARLHFARCDADHSGVLDGDELARAGARFDENGDGRALLSELAGNAGLRESDRTRAGAPEPSRFLTTRVGVDGDLARLLDGVAPFPFDVDGDRKLDRVELSRAFFAALDLDASKTLDVDELSRVPGELRQLRYGGPWASAAFAALDDSKDGRLQAKEFAVAEADLIALDMDRDGYVHLGDPVDPYWERRGIVGRSSEWPSRRAAYIALPPNITSERVLAIFDVDHDGMLGVRELRKRPELLRQLDTDGDSLVTAAEIDNGVRTVTTVGVDACPDEFVDRWDLDGDGKLADGELPETARILLRRR